LIEEHELREPRKICGPKMEEVAAGLPEVHNENFTVLFTKYYSDVKSQGE